MIVKNDIQLIYTTFDDYVPRKDFETMENEFMDLRKDFVKTDAFNVVEEQQKFMLKDLDSFISKEDYYKRLTAFNDEMNKKLESRAHAS